MCGCFFLLFYRQCHRSSLSRHRHESGHDRRKLDGKKIKSISKVVRKLKKTQESNFLHISKEKKGLKTFMIRWEIHFYFETHFSALRTEYAMK